MEISFQTKEKSNREQEAAFLALAGNEPMRHFFALMEEMKAFPPSVDYDTKDNFVLE